MTSELTQHLNAKTRSSQNDAEPILLIETGGAVRAPQAPDGRSSLSSA
jgi:hypothetical protein